MVKFQNYFAQTFAAFSFHRPRIFPRIEVKIMFRWNFQTCALVYHGRCLEGSISIF